MSTTHDPVWRRHIPMTTYAGREEGPGWYHWCYDDAGYVRDHAGPFNTEAEARQAHASIKPEVQL